MTKGQIMNITVEHSRLRAIEGELDAGRTSAAQSLAGQFGRQIFIGVFDELGPDDSAAYPRAAALIKERLEGARAFYGRGPRLTNTAGPDVHTRSGGSA